MATIETECQPRGRGRPLGVNNVRSYKWDVTFYDLDTDTFIKHKCTSVKDINEKFGLKLNSDYVRRIMSRYRADLSMRNGQNSFLARWGHIHIKKINEPIHR